MFAARVPGEDLAGLAELVVEGLAERDARALLESVLAGLAGSLDARVRDRVIADAHGNPLALLELPRWPGGGGRVPGAVGLADARPGAPRPAGAGRGASQAPGGRT